MEPKNFIAETLSQIIEGVRLAQSGEDGANINADMAGAAFGGSLVNVGTYGVATRVDFDVSVTAETTAGAGAKLSVFGVGVSGVESIRQAPQTELASAFRFACPTEIPGGPIEFALKMKRRCAVYAATPASSARPRL